MQLAWTAEHVFQLRRKHLQVAVGQHMFLPVLGRL